MSVNVDNFVGYIINVTDEYNSFNDDGDDDIIWDKFISNVKESKLPKELIDIGFKCYYSRPRPGTDNITLLYDGMSGKYAKLIYIKTAKYYSNDESDVSPIVNEALKVTPVPDDIKEKMQKVYNTIFNNNKEIEIYLQQFNHWH